MKKLFIFALIPMFMLFFAVSCSDEDPKASGIQDNNNDVNDDETADADDDTGSNDDADDAGNTGDTGNTGNTGDTGNTGNTGDTGNSGNSGNTGTFEKIGDFNLAFEGKVNVDLSNYQSIKGGAGDVNFNYKGTPYTFGKLTVIIIQLFPLAILQQGNVAVMWLESAPGLGAETKKVFGYMFPSTIQAGQTTMEATQAFAFYGDININLQGGQFDIKCVRAAAYAGSLNMESYDGANAKFSSFGDLLDPADAGSQLPYPVCTD